MKNTDNASIDKDLYFAYNSSRIYMAGKLKEIICYFMYFI